MNATPQNTSGKTRVAVLISGSGSNLQSLIQAAQKKNHPAEIALVISNKADVYGLERAKNNGIKTKNLDHKAYANREAFDKAIHAVLVEEEIQLVCLAGFMRILTPEFVRKWPNRILNIHPSLLPSFTGLDVHQRAIDAGARFSGCTVHVVDEGLDEGPIVVQAVVPILQDDSADSLASRIITMEHQIYPMALEWFASGRASVDGQRVFIDGESEPPAPIMWPA